MMGGSRGVAYGLRSDAFDGGVDVQFHRESDVIPHTASAYFQRKFLGQAVAKQPSAAERKKTVQREKSAEREKERARVKAAQRAEAANDAAAEAVAAAEAENAAAGR
jgi:hypothetical protein